MRLRFLAATLVALLACGIPYWPIPYREVSMPGNPAPGTWLLLGTLAGVLAGYLMRPGLRWPVLAVTSGFILAVMGRIEVETSRDPTSHNLWPIEVFIVAGFGLAAGLVGVGVARLLQRLGTSR